jgi:phosphoribosylformimino-5-aminoimidazole carboxamide ribotide isomerase
MMEIIPAIDLIDGKCVRLFQGDYKQETVFSDDPVSVAAKWESFGARRLHIIDLDGAAWGMPKNMEVIKAIIDRIKIPIQLGGGIRSRETARKLWDTGINRVIIGSIAIEDPELVGELCLENAEGVVVSIDSRDGMVAIHGWMKDTPTGTLELARQVKELGVKRILYTDIKKDGTLTEPGYDAISNLINTVGIPVIAAGGISHIDHLKRLAELGADGAVLGRAIYTGDVDLKQALALDK